MGKSKNVCLLASDPVMDELSKRSLLEPFKPQKLSETGKKVNVGLNTTLEFHRVPHRDHEGKWSMGTQTYRSFHA